MVEESGKKKKTSFQWELEDREIVDSTSALPVATSGSLGAVRARSVMLENDWFKPLRVKLTIIQYLNKIINVKKIILYSLII